MSREKKQEMGWWKMAEDHFPPTHFLLNDAMNDRIRPYPALHPLIPVTNIPVAFAELDFEFGRVQWAALLGKVSFQFLPSHFTFAKLNEIVLDRSLNKPFFEVCPFPIFLYKSF